MANHYFFDSQTRAFIQKPKEGWKQYAPFCWTICEPISLRTHEIQNIQQRSKIRSIHNRTKQKNATPLVPLTSLSPGMKIQGYLIIYTNLHQHFLGQMFYVFRLKWRFLNLSTSTVFVSQISVLILC